MKRTYLLLLVLFLILIPIISATPIMEKSSPVDSAMKMINWFPQKCYEEQGGDLLFVPEKFKTWGMSKTFEENPNLFWESLQKKIAINYCNKKASPSCIKDTIQKITVIPSNSNVEDACGYAPDTEKCYSCVKDNEKNKERSALLFGIVLFTILALFPLSILYLLCQGVFYLIKKRIFGPRWLFILVIILGVISFLAWGASVMSVQF